MIFKILEYVVYNPWKLALASLLLVLAAAYGGQNLAISNDYRNFFSDDNPELLAFENLQNTYNKSDNVLFLITPKDGQVFTPQTLAGVQWLTEQSWQTPFSSRVDSITNFQHTTAVEDDLFVANLVEDPNQSQEALRKIKAIATAEPLLVRRLINAEGTVTAINVTVQLPGLELQEAPIVANFAHKLAQQLEERDPNLKVRMTGMVMMNNAFGEASLKDASTLIPTMFLVVTIILALMLRNVTLTLATIVVFALSAASAMGVAGWMQIKLDPMTMSAPTIILTMAVADCVHLLSTYISQMRHGLQKSAAMVEALRINFMPIFITSATTALGFLSMNFSEIPPLNHMGNVVAVGVLAAFLLSITFLPAVVMILPFTKIKQAESKHHYLAGFSHFVVKQRRILLFVMFGLSVLATAFVPLNQINDEFVNYFDESIQFRQDTEYAADNLVGPYTIEFSFNSNEEGGIADPVYLSQLEKFVAHLYTYPATSHVFSFSETMKQLNKNMHGDDPTWLKMPDSQELAAQYTLLYEMSLPYGLDLNNQIDIGKSSTRITLSTINLSSQEILNMEIAINTWLSKNIPNIDIIASSPNLMFAHVGVRNAKSLVIGAVLALFLISLILMWALGSVKMGLISLIPNLLPAGIAFGIWGLIDGQVGMSVSIVIGMTLGIVVDDSVHFLSKYLRARREKGLNAIEATHYAFANVGNALVITTLVLITGFLVLTLSNFKMNADMGLVTAITIAAALVIDFLLLPPLLMALDKAEYPAPSTSSDSSETLAVATPLATNAVPTPTI
ncbi:MAG: putative RND superfamily exporter protein [Lentisphaeria bacterium]